MKRNTNASIGIELRSWETVGCWRDMSDALSLQVKFIDSQEMWNDPDSYAAIEIACIICDASMTNSKTVEIDIYKIIEIENDTYKIIIIISVSVFCIIFASGSGRVSAPIYREPWNGDARIVSSETIVDSTCCEEKICIDIDVDHRIFTVVARKKSEK